MALPLKRQESGFAPLRQLQRDMDGLFQDFFGRFPSVAEDFGLTPAFPAMDIRETDKTVEVEVEVPGMQAKDIDISVVNSTLTIRGEKDERQEEKSGYAYRVERRYGRFERSVHLPAEVLVEKANADYKEGILRISMPKKREDKVFASTRKIPIK